jgi:hypothetical protein
MPENLPLEGSIMPLKGQVPKGTSVYPTSAVKQAMIDGKPYTHCPFEGKYVSGRVVMDPPEGPKITNVDGATIYKCPSCGKVLATVGNSRYQTGIGQNATQSSNKGRVPPRS